jgi:6-pyruvoyltetrahydropterin/6-carboxytetrahydropterin synthase
MHTVSKDFSFEAGHALNPRLLGAKHKCCRPHGHSYRVRIYCVAHDLDFRGFVVDYAEISAAVDPLIAQLDHQFLNDILPFHTTAENLAQWFHDELIEKLPTLSRVDLYETPKTCCSYVPS